MADFLRELVLYHWFYELSAIILALAYYVAKYRCRVSHTAGFGNTVAFTRTDGVCGDTVPEDLPTGAGRRVVKASPHGTHAFFYDGWMPVREEIALPDGSASCVEYFWGKDLSGTVGGAGGVGGLLYVKVDGAIYIPYYDANGNVTGYWNAAGETVAEYAYDAFGATVSATGPLADSFSIRYSTKYYDVESDLYYYGHRFYAPSLHRWLTRDPIGVRDSANEYTFCKNNPTGSIDELGLLRILTGAFSYNTPGRDDAGDLSIARAIVRLVNNGLNGITDVKGRKCYDASVQDLLVTGVPSVRAKADKYPNDVYIIAHGGIVRNGSKHQGGDFLRETGWFSTESVYFGLVPDGKGTVVPLSWYGDRLSRNHVYACYISGERQGVGGLYVEMQFPELMNNLFQEIDKYRKNRPQACPCTKAIFVFEGERDGGEDASIGTEAALDMWGGIDENFYSQSRWNSY